MVGNNSYCTQGVRDTDPKKINSTLELDLE